MNRHNQAISLQCNMLMNFSFTFHLLIDGYWNPHFHHIEDLTRTASCLTVSQSIPYMTRVPYTIHDGMRYLSCIATTTPPTPTAIYVQLMANLRAWIIVYCAPVKRPFNREIISKITISDHLSLESGGIIM